MRPTHLSVEMQSQCGTEAKHLINSLFPPACIIEKCSNFHAVSLLSMLSLLEPPRLKANYLFYS